jgi:hypothetical protein
MVSEEALFSDRANELLKDVLGFFRFHQSRPSHLASMADIDAANATVMNSVSLTCNQWA